MVEFALILPLLLLIILGLVEFGYRYERSARLNNAAFIAAREIAIHKTDYDTLARSADPSMPSGATIVADKTPAGCTSGNVTVTITSSESSPTKFFPPGQLTFTVVAKGVAKCDG